MLSWTGRSFIDETNKPLGFLFVCLYVVVG